MIAKRIAAAMSARRMTQADIIRAAGISSAQVNHIVSGRTKDPGARTLAKVADTLDVSVDWLLGRTYIIQMAAADGMPKWLAEATPEETIKLEEYAALLKAARK